VEHKKPKKISAGEIITCPNCDFKMYQFIIDCQNVDNLKKHHIATLNSKLKPVQTSKGWACPKCDALFMVKGHLHLESGWYPTEPKI